MYLFFGMLDFSFHFIILILGFTDSRFDLALTFGFTDHDISVWNFKFDHLFSQDIVVSNFSLQRVDFRLQLVNDSILGVFVILFFSKKLNSTIENEKQMKRKLRTLDIFKYLSN